MGFTLAQQTQQFLGSLLLGAALGMVYDLFRVGRRSFSPPAWAVFSGDLCFLLLAGGVLLRYLLERCWGEVRGFVVLGAALGFFCYCLTVSGWVVALLSALVRLLGRLAVFFYRPVRALVKYAEKWGGKCKKRFSGAPLKGKRLLQLRPPMMYNRKDHKIQGKGEPHHGAEDL